MNESLRIAIVQQRMYWTTQENTQFILGKIESAARHGAQICVFPELAVTGFHRQIRTEATPEIVAPALSDIRKACAKFRVASLVGTPTFDTFGNIFNSAEFITDTGETCATIAKIGITPAEATFFAEGAERPIVDFLGHRSTAILCREANDVELLQAQIATNTVDIIYWPGIMRPDPEKPDNAEHHLLDASSLAKHTGAYIIQANWPMSLNYPEESIDSGHSIVISPSGETLFRLPKAQVGMGVFTLGDTHFIWIEL
ncbi:MAG: carbon-nitrogen hydrolase family protein [Burkholderiales bacterium]|nr:MAG: carbon-nitrogen hydrolase family protein [Betaproteobacteria bacterium]TAG83889.1 MAG: carbon-nitrogen hydrolase family protein [Burkholderiales bacterium]